MTPPDPALHKSLECLGVGLNPLTMTQTVALIIRRIQAGQFTQHSVVNVAKLIHMRQDPQLRAAVTQCDIVNIDGMGVVWGARFLGRQVPERVAGIDLFLQLLACSAREGFPVYLLGAREAVVQAAAANVQKQYPALQIAGIHHGYFWDDEAAVVEKIRASGARLLFVAITSPQKENFIQRWREALGVQFVMGVGGSFDVLAGLTRRAPVWMQRWGLEWLYRLLQEPGRMWKRYLVTNAQFAWLLFVAKTRQVFGMG